MTTRRAALALALACASAGGARADTPALAAAQRATRELRFEDANAEVEQAIRRGHHAYKDVVALYALRAEVAAIVGGAAAGEAEFRRLLVVAPDHTPSRNTPIFSVPFTHAQRWVAAHGPVAVEHKLAAAPRLGVSTPLAVVVANDPLAMVAGARLFVRLLPEAPYVAAPGTSLRPSLPPVPTGGAADYYLDVLDAADNVLAQVGTPEEPFTLEAPPPPPPAPAPLAPSLRAPERVAPASTAPALVVAAPAPRAHHPYRIAGGVLTSFGLGALGAAIGVDVTGKQQLDTLQSSCAPSCTQSQIDELRVREHAAIGLYAAAGVALTTSAILFTIDLVRHRR